MELLPGDRLKDHRLSRDRAGVDALLLEPEVRHPGGVADTVEVLRIPVVDVEFVFAEPVELPDIREGFIPERIRDLETIEDVNARDVVGEAGSACTIEEIAYVREILKPPKSPSSSIIKSPLLDQHLPHNAGAQLLSFRSEVKCCWLCEPHRVIGDLVFPLRGLRRHAAARAAAAQSTTC